MKFIHFLVVSLVFLGAAHGNLECEKLAVGKCSFSIASSGMRCLLETHYSPDPEDGTPKFHCQTSNVMATNMQEHIETDECIAACGVDRKSVGISSDSLLDRRFIANLCSPPCYQNCPNIVDLYYNLATEEGVFLPDLCKTQNSAMSRFLSSGAAFGPESPAAAGPTSEMVFGPASSASVDCAPAPM